MGAKHNGIINTKRNNIKVKKIKQCKKITEIFISNFLKIRNR